MQAKWHLLNFLSINIRHTNSVIKDLPNSFAIELINKLS